MTRRFHRSNLRCTLALTTALAGSVAWIGTAGAQALPKPGDVISTSPGTAILGAPGISNPNATTLQVDLHAVNTVINWNGFNVPAGTLANFSDKNLVRGTPIAVLNRDMNAGGKLSQIMGQLKSDPNVAVWVYNPNGILVGNGAAINVGSLVLTTLNLSDTDFRSLTSSTYALTTDAGSKGSITVDPNATITLGAGNRGLIMVAPRISSQGTLNAAGQDVAFVTASDVTLKFTAGSPLAITINQGTSVPGTSQLVKGTISGRNVLFALASQASVTDALLDVEPASLTAVGGTRGIQLVAGRAAPSGSQVTIAGTAASDTGGVVKLKTAGSFTSSTAGTDILAGASGSLTGGATLTAARDVTIAGLAGVTQSGAVDAGRDYTVSGTGAVTLGSVADVTQSARGAVSITTEDGNLTGLGGLTLVANSDGLGNEALTLASGGASGGDILFGGTTLMGGSASQSDVRIRSRDSGNRVTLGDVTARGLLGATGTAGFGGALTRTARITLGNVTTTNALVLTAPTLVAASLRTTGSGQGITLAATDLTVTGAATTTGANSDIVANTQVDGTGNASFGAISAKRDVSIGQGSAYDTLTVNGAIGGRNFVSTTSGAAQLTTATLTGSFAATSTGAGLTVNAVQSTGNLTLSAATSIGGTAGGRASLSSTSGKLSVTAGGAGLFGTLAGTTATTVQAGSLDITTASSSAGAVTLTATGGDLLLGGGSSASNYSVSANGAGSLASVVNAVSAGSDYAVTGGSVALGADADPETQIAKGAVTITAATGSISGGPGLTLVSNSDNVGSELMLLDAATSFALGGTTLQAGGNGLSNIEFDSGADTSGAFAAGAITANRIDQRTGADPVTTGTFTRTGNVTFGNLHIGTAGAANAIISTGGMLTTGAVTLGQGTTATGATTLTGASGVTIGGAIGGRGDLAIASATGPVSVQNVNLLGALTLGAATGVSGGALTASTVDASGGSVTLTSATTTVGALNLTASNGALSVGTAKSAAAALLRATGGVGGVRINAASAVGDLTVQSNAWLAAVAGTGRAALSSTGGALAVTAAGPALLGVVSGASGASVTAGSIDATSANASGGAVDLTASAGVLNVGTVSAARTAKLTTLGAAQAISVNTATAAGNLTIAATGELSGLSGTRANLTSSGGALSVTAGGAGLIGTASGATGAAIQATSLSVTAANSSGGAVALTTSAGNLTLGSGSATGDYRVTANGAGSIAAVGGAISAGGAYRVSGGVVSLDAGNAAVTQAAKGLVSIVANGGAITGGAGLMLVADSDNSGGEELDIGGATTGAIALGGTTLKGGGAGGSRVVFTTSDDTSGFVIGDVFASTLGSRIGAGAEDANAVERSGAITTGKLTLGAFTRILSDAATVTTGAITAPGGIRLRGASGVTVGGTIDNGGLTDIGSANGFVSLRDVTAGDLTLKAATALTGTTLSSDTLNAVGGSVSLTSAQATMGALSLTATSGNLSVGSVEASGAVALATTGAIGDVLVDTATAGSDLTVSSAGKVQNRTNGRATLTSTGGALGVTAGGAALLGTIAGDTGATITAATIDAPSVASAHGAVDLTATGGPLSVGTVTAGTTVRLRTTGATGDILANSVTGVGDVTVNAVGAFTGLGGGRADVRSTGGSVAIAAGTLARLGIAQAAGTLSIHAPVIDALQTIGGGSSIDLSAGTLTLGTIVATTGATLTATSGDLSVGSLTVSNGSATLQAAGDATLGSADVSGDLSLIAGLAANLPGAASVGGAMTIRGGSVNLGVDADRETQFANGLIDIAATNGSITGGEGLTLRSNADGVGTEFLALDATGGDIAFAASSVLNGGTMGQSDIGIRLASAGQSLTLGTVNARSLGGVDATRSAFGGLVTAGAITATGAITTARSLDLTSTGGAIALHDVTVRDAGQGMALTTSGPAGGAITATNLTAPGAIGVAARDAAGFTNVTGGSVAVTGSSVGITSASATNGALAITTTGGALDLGSGQAATTATLTAAGALTVATTLTAIGDVSAAATGALRLPTATSTGGTVTLRGSTADIGTADAHGALAITASGGALNLGTGTAGGTATLEAAGALAIGTALSAGGDAVLAANGALTAPLVQSTGGGVAITSGGDAQLTTVRAGGGDITIGATGAVSGLNGTRTDLAATGAGGDIRLMAGGTALLGPVAATGLVDVTARSIDVSSVVAIGGTLNLTATGGDVLLGSGTAGGLATLRATGNVTTGPLTSAGLVLDAGSNATGTTVTSSGPLSIVAGGVVDVGTLGGSAVTASGSSVMIGTATSGSTLDLTATGGALTLGTGSAGTTVTLNAAGPLTVTGGLIAGGDATAATAGVATIAAIGSTGGLVAVRGTAVDVTRANAATTLDLVANAGDARLGTGSAGGAATIEASGALVSGTLAAGGAVTVKAGGAATLGETSAGGAVSVTAAGIQAGKTTAGTTLAFTSGGAIGLAQGQAGGDATFDAVGNAALGAVTAGAASTITIKASDAAITGVQSAANVMFINRVPASGAFKLGDGASAGGFALSQDEVNFVRSDKLSFDGGSGDIEFGGLAFGAGAGAKAINVYATGRIDVLGAVSGSGTGRSILIGGSATNTTDKAGVIEVVATPDAGGRLLFDTADLELRGTRIGVGLATGFLDPIGFGTDTGLPVGQVIGSYVSNANSSLYNPTFGGALYTPGNVTLISAGTLTVRYADYALFQNTGTPGTNAGVVLGSVTAPVATALVIESGGNAGNGFALFGTINGIGGTATALLGSQVISIDGIDLAGSRINGCLIGSGAGCLTTVVTQPVLNVFDTSRLDVFRSADDLALPFDPVIGTNNEALFSGVTVLDTATGTACTADAADPSCKQNQVEGK